MSGLADLDLNLLVVFEAVYATGNTGSAGDRLGMSQPAVSNALARLRRLTGEELFVRQRRGVAPTAAAHRLIGPVRAALTLIDGQVNGDAPVDLATYRRQFRILLPDPLEPIVLPPIVRQLHATAPGVSIECIRPTRGFADELRAGTLDIACVAYALDAPDIVVQPIRRFDPVVVARRGHPQIDGGFDAETFNRLGHVALLAALRVPTRIDEDLAAQGLRQRAIYTVDKLWSIPAMVEQTELLGLVPRWFAAEIAGNFNIEIHEVPAKLPDRDVYIIWHARSTDDPGHVWLREQMVAAMNEGPKGELGG